MSVLAKTAPARLAAPAAIAAGAVLLRLLSGVGFVNYDTLYALAWGGQLARGQSPAYDVPIAPTPHPLLELLGLVLSPLGPRTISDVTVGLAFLALSGCAWVVYRLGAVWFGRAAGAVAGLVFVTRVPVLSYGVRAYVDLPYVLLVLGALLVETGRRAQTGRAAGAPVLLLLALAGLLRPEAWAFSGLYWLYAIGWRPRAIAPGAPRPADERSSRGRALALALLAATAPLIWLLSDLAVTGHPLWSLTHTRSTASALARTTGIANVPEYIPRRIGEILQPAGLLGAAVGGVLALLWLRQRARIGAVAGAAAVIVFAAFASLGLPINTRYAFLAAAILAVFCGAGAFGWMGLAPGARRRGWMAGGAVVLLALIASAPSQYRQADRQFAALARQQRIEGDLLALLERGALDLRCGPVGVPNHASVPLLALYLKTSPANVRSAEGAPISSGSYLDPASVAVERDYVLDKRDPHAPASVPPGFSAVTANRSWLVFRRCSK